jgi:hypothetical protein
MRNSAARERALAASLRPFSLGTERVGWKGGGCWAGERGPPRGAGGSSTGRPIPPRSGLPRPPPPKLRQNTTLRCYHYSMLPIRKIRIGVPFPCPWSATHPGPTFSSRMRPAACATMASPQLGLHRCTCVGVLSGAGEEGWGRVREEGASKHEAEEGRERRQAPPGAVAPRALSLEWAAGVWGGRRRRESRGKFLLFRGAGGGLMAVVVVVVWCRCGVWGLGVGGGAEGKRRRN